MPLIIFRYISKQVLQILLAVTAVVLLIIMSGRFVNYLAQAASGGLKAEILFPLIAWRIPEFLVLILPLGLFMGIILTHGQLYVDNEITVLKASGMSRYQLLGITALPGLAIMVLVAVFSLYTAPLGLQHVDRIIAEQDSLTEFDTIMPGRFQVFSGGQRMMYTESLSDDRQKMEDVFIANRNASKKQTNNISVLISDRATIEHGEKGSRYVVLHDGYRYDLIPGQQNVRMIRYGSYGLRMEDSPAKKELSKEWALPTQQLFGQTDTELIAELQWRLAVPFMVPVIILLAVPLAQVRPRQGRFVKLLPAILIYLLYVALMMAARGAVDSGTLPPVPGIWAVHIPFFLLAVFIYSYEPVKQALDRRRHVHGKA
ncbi:Lipopolysaccharide export system permease protein LptF [invertebrate metagenome]|uniref:Lipopolysaccharide export system permease protein LptF n=1 Tax=invertebrate metagenome TaxID=1711999 RepID=A0A2H9T6H0_9ZZZZ